MSLQIKDLSKTFNIHTLFKEVTFAINPSERVALVGSNGSGKTTLMKIILGDEAPDSGQVILPKNTKIGYLPQEIFLINNPAWDLDGGSATLWNLAAGAFSDLFKIQAEIAQIEHKMAQGDTSAQLQETHARLLILFEHSGGYVWQAKTIRILKGLGFSEERFHEPIRNFSGGWQMRAYFARILLSEPDFLLLDEPTNYLDITSIAFLEEYLTNYPGGVLVVSHDRYFLDHLATSVVALVPEGVRIFRGNYSEFLEAHDQWAKDAQASLDRQTKERKRVEKFIERFRYKATKASQVQSRIKMLEKLETIEQARPLPKLDFSFPDCPPTGEVVLRAKEISRNFDRINVLSNLDLSVYRGDRLAIIGENGTGKTTLMRIIAGQDSGFSGAIEWGYRVCPAYFAQDEEISFEKDETIYERLLRDSPFEMVPQLRKLLGAFLFSGDFIDRRVAVLSGGEKSRLGLARLMLKPTNVLLLDEPTNHLDINSREALLNALDEFPGTIIIVSHDRYFLDCLATRILALKDGKAIIYEGNYSQYLWARNQRIPDDATVTVSDDKEKNPAPATDSKDAWKERKRLNNLKQRIEREVGILEENITKLETQISLLESQLANPPMGITRDELTALSRQHLTTTDELSESMSKWEDLQKKLMECTSSNASS